MIKEKVKALWNLCFDDNKAFVDMYFRLRYNNEVNIAIQSGKEVISALQMIPYPMTFCGKQIETAYISGACTHPDFRGNGVMQELLSQAFARMNRNRVAISTLIPAEPWLFGYYARLGYVPVFRYSIRIITGDFPITDKVSIQKITEFDESVYYYFNHKMEERNCCIQHTADDFKVIIADTRVSDGAVYTAMIQNKVAGIAITYQREDALYIDELFANDTETRSALIGQIQKENESGEEIVLTEPASVGTEQPLLGMARIIDARHLLQLYAAFYPGKEVSIELTDNQLSANNGYYYIRRGKCIFSKERLPGTHLQQTISELGEYLLAPMHPYMSLMLN